MQIGTDFGQSWPLLFWDFIIIFVSTNKVFWPSLDGLVMIYLRCRAVTLQSIFRRMRLLLACSKSCFSGLHVLGVTSVWCCAVALERTAWQSPVDAGAISERGKLQVCCPAALCLCSNCLLSSVLNASCDFCNLVLLAVIFLLFTNLIE